MYKIFLDVRLRILMYDIFSEKMGDAEVVR